jgi:hypothetical protein
MARTTSRELILARARKFERWKGSIMIMIPPGPSIAAAFRMAWFSFGRLRIAEKHPDETTTS